MKKPAIFLLFLCIAGLSVLLFRPQPAPEAPPAVPVPTPTTTAPAAKTVVFKNQTFAYSLVRIIDPKTLSLVANFDQKQSAAEIVSQNGCTAAVNASFYDTDGQPLGFFAQNGKILRASVLNALLNGYVSVDEKGVAVISPSFPGGKLQLGLQSGPLVMLDNAPLPLRIKNDEPARRMAILTDTTGAVVFAAVYTQDAVFDGPMLTDLPLVLTEISKKEHIQFATGINLDGGSASFFTDGRTTLPELTSVGGLFCAGGPLQ